jgi:hypothetical protein
MRAESYLNRQPEREVTRESEQARTSVEGERVRVRVLHHQMKDKESENLLKSVSRKGLSGSLLCSPAFVIVLQGFWPRPRSWDV